MAIEKIILKNLLDNETFTRKALPFLQDEYFSNISDKTIFKTLKEYVIKYNSLPNKEAVIIAVSNTPKLKDDTLKECVETLEEIDKEIKEEKIPVGEKWLLDETEKFCQEKAIYNAVLESIEILDKKSPAKKTKGAIPELLTKALSVSFDTNIGHDFLIDSDKRYDYYHKVENKVPFDIEYFNKITNGGVPFKTLNVVMGSTGVGKTLFLCHQTANYLSQGYDVLYITMEMAEEEIAKRIDVNLLNISLDDLKNLPKDMYDNKINKLRENTKGKLLIREFPTAAAGALHFKSLLNELYLKKNFKPQIIVIDYLNICCSSRIKPGGENSYIYVKSIAEELRGIAVEYNCIIWSATQSNRIGFTNSDAGMENVSECIFIEERVKLVDGKEKEIGKLSINDIIMSHNGPRIVNNIFDKKIKKCYRITTKTGKSIIISEDHIIPTKTGNKSIKSLLKIGDIINTIES